jgi:integrase
MARKKLKGGFRKLQNGTIEYQVSLPHDIYGKRRRKAFYGKSEDECIDKYRNFVKNVSAETDTPRKHTLATWILDTWLPKFKQHKVEASTYADYIHLATHVKNHAIGDMKLDAVKSLHITEYFNDKIELSQSFRKRSKFLLNAAFESAIDNDFCTKNPVRGAEIASKQTPEKESFTESETQTILDFAEQDELFGVTACIMLNTGVRAGEMRAMQVSSIDFDRGFIAIDRAVKRTGELGLPKNKKTRQIPLEASVAAFLKERLRHKSGYIIGGDAYVTHLGFSGFYCCVSIISYRHTFASLRQKNGMPVAIVAQLLGHHSTEVTDKYTHLGDVDILSDAVRKYAFSKRMA